MNRVIALYMGGKEFFLGSKCWFSLHPYGDPFLSQIKYHASWDWLMPVWDKLRDELKPFSYKVDGYNRTNNQGVNMKYAIADAIAYHGIEKSHRLIYEAIVWLNTNKPAQ